uniref:Uncharacterized protein n=1 Tax=Faecalibaculum rodentium TaxID=1702221 RepID=A0A140DRW5_9FIRM|nr:hypothetical protein AALO17_02580 [Faecalibaculum rodentium]
MNPERKNLRFGGFRTRNPPFSATVLCSGHHGPLQKRHNAVKKA